MKRRNDEITPKLAEYRRISGYFHSIFSTFIAFFIISSPLVFFILLFRCAIDTMKAAALTFHKHNKKRTFSEWFLAFFFFCFLVFCLRRALFYQCKMKIVFDDEKWMQFWHCFHVSAKLFSILSISFHCTAQKFHLNTTLCVLQDECNFKIVQFSWVFQLTLRERLWCAFFFPKLSIVRAHSEK